MGGKQHYPVIDPRLRFLDPVPKHKKAGVSAGLFALVFGGAYALPVRQPCAYSLRAVSE